MSNSVATARFLHRSRLLRNVYSLGNQERHQLNAIFRRSASEIKTFSKPAPYFTKDVVVGKVMELTPGWIFVTIVFLGCKFYLKWNGIDYNEIINYKANYETMEKPDRRMQV